MILRVALFVFALFPALIFGQASPAQVSIEGLQGRATVRRDARAIPYLEAASDDDLYFVQGYITASDRLWQMDLMRRVALGETAEIFGKQALAEDKRWRTFGFRKVADESLAHLSPELRAALENYARGVNAYIATLDEKNTPPEFRILQYRPAPWRPADSIVLGKILADALSTTWRSDLLRAAVRSLPKEKVAELSNPVTPLDVVLFGKDVPVRAAADSKNHHANVSESVLAKAESIDELRKTSLERIGFYAEELAASNNWVISGKRTADGKPIIANDPHLLATAPGIWYLSHLTGPNVRVAGVTFPGVPGIVLGHNESIAWGATNVGPDVQDLYIETFSADGKYKTPTGPSAPTVRKEEIKVRVNPLKTDVSTEIFEVVETRNGPVILEEDGKKFSLKWTALDPKNSEFEAFFRLNRAKNWDDFKKAFSNYGGPTQNFVYADTEGNIGWYAAGRIPIRRKGDGSLPYDGATADGDWVEMIPFEELPHLYNPASGLIVTANQRIVGTAYKYPQMSRDAAPPWRARRIFDLLNANGKADMDLSSSVQYDDLNIPLRDLAKEIVEMGAGSAALRKRLEPWDGRMRPESGEALVVNEIRQCIAIEIAKENKPVPANIIRERIVWNAVSSRSALWLPKQFADYNAFLNHCESVAVSEMNRKYGTDPAKHVWASATRSRFMHPLAAVPFIGAQFATPAEPLSGSGQTPNVGIGVSMRFVASPGNWDATRHVIPLGQSGDPRSKHFKDQFESWRTGKPEIFPFSQEAVSRAAVETVAFGPK